MPPPSDAGAAGGKRGATAKVHRMAGMGGREEVAMSVLAIPEGNMWQTRWWYGVPVQEGGGGGAQVELANAIGHRS